MPPRSFRLRVSFFWRFDEEDVSQQRYLTGKSSPLSQYCKSNAHVAKPAGASLAYVSLIRLAGHVVERLFDIGDAASDLDGDDDAVLLCLPARIGCRHHCYISILVGQQELYRHNAAVAGLIVTVARRGYDRLPRAHQESSVRRRRRGGAYSLAAPPSVRGCRHGLL